ncbi:MAG: glycoside hydrolase family 16 protein, partial [Labilibaculum sp.]|nr:glycoside hydrolase family 16 protein [Labilibaculum sp.]
WPYIKPFYLILNVAVGGAWGSVEGIDTEVFPQTMQVDYVRIYQKNK